MNLMIIIQLCGMADFLAIVLRVLFNISIITFISIL